MAFDQNDMMYVTLSNGVKMPQLGYGVYQVTQEECERCVRDALEVGYRHIDTAQSYFNEEQVGNAIASAASNGIQREGVFLTTKVWLEHYGEGATRVSVEDSLRKLKTDYLDLVLLHQPFGDAFGACALRVNPSTKQRFLSDPTIRFWQVSDAPHLKDKATLASYMNWAVKQAEMMKRIGFTQPITIAYMPLSPQAEANEQPIEDILSHECFDAVALSLDPMRMGWLTAGELHNGLGRIYVRYTDILQMVMRIAQAYDKPFFLTDCAYPRTALFTRPGTNTESRDNFVSFLQSTYTDMTEGDQRTPFLGIIFKGWGGIVRPSTDLWTNPYDFTAEYPDETKGRYSIFTNDSTTIQLLSGAWAR